MVCEKKEFKLTVWIPVDEAFVVLAEHDPVRQEGVRPVRHVLHSNLHRLAHLRHQHGSQHAQVHFRFVARHARGVGEVRVLNEARLLVAASYSVGSLGEVGGCGTGSGELHAIEFLFYFQIIAGVIYAPQPVWKKFSQDCL